MKTYCKDTDITDYETIKRAIHKCLANKLRRKDVREYLLGCDVKSEYKRDEYSLKIKTDFVDILGFRYYGFKVKTSLRRRTFKKCRRCYIRVCNNVRNRQKISIERARRFVSLYGRLKKTNHYKLRCKYSKIFQMCKGVISAYDKSKVYRGAAQS